MYRIFLKELSNYPKYQLRLMPSSAHACTRACPAAPRGGTAPGRRGCSSPWSCTVRWGSAPPARPALAPAYAYAPGGDQHRLLPLLQERSQPEIPFSWSPNLQVKFEAAKNTPTATAQAGSPACEPQEIHRGLPCPAHRCGLVHGNALLVPLCASRVLH